MGTAVGLYEVHPLDLQVKRSSDLLQVRASVEISYPKRYRLVLHPNFNGYEIGIEEGLFGMLQDAGWLFPYTAVYTFEVSAEDPRLRDPNLQRGRLERLILWLGGAL